MNRPALLTLLAMLAFSLLHAQESGTCISGTCKTGYGSMRYPDSSIYTGSWKAGKWDGRGTLDEAERTYTGRWTAGLPSDSGVFVAKHILTREHRLFGADVRIGTVRDGILSGLGIFIDLAINAGRIDTLSVWKGNFANDQLSGAGISYIPKLAYDTSGSWTDNYHFTSGTHLNLQSGEKRSGSSSMGIITETPESLAARNAIAPAPAAASRTGSNSGASPQPAQENMLDYGIFNMHQKKLKQEDIATFTPAPSSPNGSYNTSTSAPPKKDAWSMCSCCKGLGYTETYTSDTRYTYQNRYGTNTETKMLRNTCSCCHGTGR